MRIKLYCPNFFTSYIFAQKRKKKDVLYLFFQNIAKKTQFSEVFPDKKTQTCLEYNY